MKSVACFKDGAYFCFYAYVLCISRYSGFLWVVLTNTGIFLRGLKLCGESRTQQVLLESKKKIGGDHAFFRDNKASISKKKKKKKPPYIALYFTAFSNDYCLIISKKKCVFAPFFYGFQ